MKRSPWKTFKDSVLVTLLVMFALFGTVYLINQAEISRLDDEQAEFNKTIQQVFYPCDGGNPSRPDVQVPQLKC